MSDLQRPVDSFAPAPWHILLHSLKAGAETSNHAAGADPSLCVGPDQLGAFPVTFEQTLDRLAGLPRLFVEPDGALVWVGEHVGHSWQLDGVVYDRDGGVWYVELKGRCPRAELERLAGLLGWPAAPVVVQLVQAGEWVTLEVFLSGCMR